MHSMSKPPLDELTEQFWRAVWFIRRAPDRDQSHAVKILRHVYSNATGVIRKRAGELLEKIDNGTGQYATGADE